MDNLKRHQFFCKIMIQSVCQSCRFPVQLLLKGRTFLLQPLQNCQSSIHSQRMLAERSGYKCSPFFMRRERGIPKRPHPSVYAVQISFFSSDDANRQTSTDHLAIDHHIGFNAEPCLRTSRMNPKSSDDFVKNQSDALCGGQRT
ncbi:hypothetical protein D3C74_382490 [compost metagenome]